MTSIIKALLAASMLMPVAAQAQEQDGRERGEWNQRARRAERPVDAGDAAPARPDRPQREPMRRDAGPAPDQRRDAPRPAWNGQGGGFDRRATDGATVDRDDRRSRDPRVGGWNRDGDDAARRPAEIDRNGGNRDWNRGAQAGDPRWRERPARDGDRRPTYRQPGQERGDWRGTGQRGWDDRGWNDGRNRGDGRDWDDRRRFDARSGAWNRGWRNDDRYDWTRYRKANRGAYRLPRYYAPSGWGYGYRRFSVGVSLASILFSERYWIEDPYAYRLPDAYGPYRWVRYYDDALLVDLRTGQVVDTVYDIFD